MPTQTLSEWEHDREFSETRGEIATLPEIEEPPTFAEITAGDPEHGWIALAGRWQAGFGVQLLWHPVTAATAITVAEGGVTFTFDIPAEHALDAFHHPYVYSAV